MYLEGIKEGTKFSIAFLIIVYNINKCFEKKLIVNVIIACGFDTCNYVN